MGAADIIRRIIDRQQAEEEAARLRDDVRPQLDEDFGLRQQLRERGRAAAFDTAGAAHEVADTLRDSRDIGQAAIRRQAAQALAAQSGRAGAMAFGGGQAADLRQAAADLGMQEATFGAQIDEAAARARQDAAAQDYEAAIAAEELGSLSDERLERQQFYLSQIAAIKEEQSGFFGLDENAAAAEIARLADSEPDPFIRRWLSQRAAQVRNS